MRILIVTTSAICLALGFFAGQLTQTSSTENLPAIGAAPHEPIRETPKPTANKTIATASITSNADVHSNKDCISPAVIPSKEKLPVTTAANSNDLNPSNKVKLKFTTTTELSNESVDELVPKPFNNSIKNMHGKFKEKYADFLASETKSEWAENAENYLKDALDNGMLGNSLEINSIKCQAALCEVRVYEREANTAITNINKQLSNFTNYFQEANMSTSSDENRRTFITYLMLAKESK